MCGGAPLTLYGWLPLTRFVGESRHWGSLSFLVITVLADRGNWVAASEIVAFLNGVDSEWSSSGSERRKLLTFRLFILSRLITRQSTRYLKKHHDLSVAEWAILAQLADVSPRTLRQFAGYNHIDKAQLSRASSALLKRGLLEREFDPKDGRSVLFLITPEGRELRDKVLPARREFNKKLMDQLSEEDCSGLDSGIDALTNYLTDEFGGV